MSLRMHIICGLLGYGLACSVAAAKWEQPVKIGVLTDMNGTYADMGGPGSVIAAQMAIDDCLKAECKGMTISVISADHMNKAEIGANKAREWRDMEKVGALVDLTNSSVALAVQKIIREKGGIALYTGPATTKLTNEDCAPTGFHWMFDTYALSAGTARVMTTPGKTWYFITADYAFGHSLERDAAEVIAAGGGKVLGSVRHPLGTPDFSSFLIQAQASKAQVIGLSNGGGDTATAIKQMREFNLLGNGQQMAALLLFITDIHALGLEVAQGITLTDGFYPDLDDDTRQFSARFQKLHKGRKPSMVQAGVYSAVYHYLRAVVAAQTDESNAVAAKMRQLPIRDPVMRNASILPNGRVIHDMYLLRVKKPSESRGAWDYYNLIQTIPAIQAFQPIASSQCPNVRK